MSGQTLDFDIPEWNGYRGPDYEEELARLIEKMDSLPSWGKSFCRQYRLTYPF